MEANGMDDPTKLRLGQKITIPKKGAKSRTDKAVSLKQDSSSAVIRKSKTIIIDPGHGGHDRGASRSGIYEADLNLQVAMRLEKSLKRNGYRVVLTRRSNTYLSLSKRAAIANRYRSALFISIHFNATNGNHNGVHGSEVYYASKNGRTLAKLVQPQLAKYCKTRNRGTRLARYSVLMNTNCPAILVECGYLSNSAELKRSRKAAFQESTASAITKGILLYDKNN